MTTSAGKAGRNDLCPCGSGKKFKRCCGAVAVEAEDGMSRFFGVAAMLAGAALLAGVVMIVVRLASGSGQAGEKVWSAEHGHYHTVGGDGDHAGGGGPGKVWSEEHQHWHDTNAKPAASMEAPSPGESALKGLREAQMEDAARQGGAAPSQGEAEPSQGGAEPSQEAQ